MKWRADKAGMQARGVTEKAYVEQCKVRRCRTDGDGSRKQAHHSRTQTGGTSIDLLNRIPRILFWEKLNQKIGKLLRK